MTGPEHYQKAERLLEEAAGLPASYANGHGPGSHANEKRTQMIAMAQVHATLAHAAAAGMSVPDDGGYGTRSEWRGAVMPRRQAQI